VDDATTSAPHTSSPSSKPLSRSAAYALLVALVVIWGLNWPIMKLVVHAMPPLWFVVTRLTVGAACLFAFLLATGRLATPTRADWPVVISVSVFQMWLFIGLTTIGLQFVPAGRSAILSYTMPLWVFPAAVLFFGEKLTPWKLIGMVLGLAGLIVLLNPASIDWSDRHVLLGNFLLLLGAGMWAIAILHTRRHRWHLSPLQRIVGYTRGCNVRVPPRLFNRGSYESVRVARAGGDPEQHAEHGRGQSEDRRSGHGRPGGVQERARRSAAPDMEPAQRGQRG